MTEYEEIGQGDNCTVIVHPKAYKELQKFAAKQGVMAANLLQKIQMYAQDGREYLVRTDIRDERRVKCPKAPGGKVMVTVFKAYQARLYGCLDGKNKTFVCFKFAQKKDDKAKNEFLEQTAKMFSEYLEEK